MDYDDACIVILPHENDVPQAVIDALITVLEEEADHPPLLILGQNRAPGGEWDSGETIELLPEASPAASAALIKIGTNVATRVIDGATRVIKDQYRDNRSAMKWYDRRAAAYLRANDRYFGRR